MRSEISTRLQLFARLPEAQHALRRIVRQLAEFLVRFFRTRFTEFRQAEARRQLRTLFECLDKGLVGRQWLAGVRSIADPYLFVVTRWAKSSAAGIDLRGLDNLERHFRHMQHDAGVQRALAAVEESAAAGSSWTAIPS